VSSGEAARLAHMARQIAEAFRALPPEEGAAAVAGHINQFWPVMMRRELLERYGADATGLDPLVAAATKHIRLPS